MEAALADDNLQNALGFSSISVSQLSKHNDVDPAILSSLFLNLVGQLNTHQPPKSKMPMKIIDSTMIPLNLNHLNGQNSGRLSPFISFICD